MLMEELKSWLILMRAPGLHAGIVSQLLTVFGSPRDIVAASPAALAAAGLSASATTAITQPDIRKLEADLRWLESAEGSFHSYESIGYPPLLRQLSDAPTG